MAEVYPIPTDRRFKNLTGRKFGRLTVVTLFDKFNHSYRWKCSCECGGSAIVMSANLARGNTLSCGCVQRERASKAKTTHGHTKGNRVTPEYVCWVNIHARCENEKHISYKYYGARGIRVCERWSDFKAFLADMGARPTAKHSIEREDGNKGYEPRNCRWATAKDQARNNRRNRLITFGGATKTMIEWAEEVGLSYRVLQQRILANWPVERAIFTPVRSYR